MKRAEAIEATDFLLERAFRIRLSKGVIRNGKRFLTPAGFDEVVLSLLKILAGAAVHDEQKHLSLFLQTVQKPDWVKLSPGKRSSEIRTAADRWLGIRDDLPGKIGAVVRAEGPTIVGNAKEATKARYGLKIDPHLNAVDARTVEAAAKHQALFVRDEMGRRSERFSEVARSVVAKGLEDGLDRYAIGDRLGAALNATAAARSTSYWRLIASVFSARARTYGQLSGFDEAGIESFSFEAVLDEVTSEVCRFMHGRTFSTAKALDRFNEAEASEDPEAVKDLQPWASTGKTEEGKVALFFSVGGEKRAIAEVLSPGAGQHDLVGKYRAKMSDAGLEEAGLSTPPLHGHCRSTIVPI